MKTSNRLSIIALAAATLMLLSGGAQACDKGKEKTMEVSVSAYNSVKSQTRGHANKTAWGDTLKPGMKAIAVSRDLLKHGMKHKTKVRIEGLDGHYRVLDKMGKRWKKKIDIYMGTDVKAAKKWGKKKRKITWCVEK